MIERISLNSTLLNLIIYIQDTKKQAISRGILIESESYDWYKTVQDVYYELDKTLFVKAGIRQNSSSFEKILSYPIDENMLKTEYEHLNRFQF